jgi:hypothetical protein
MAKINFENAKDRIGGMVKDFHKDNEGNFIVTEKQFDELVAQIASESTKTFADAIAKQTKKVTGRKYDARISTYKYNFGFFKFS